MLNSVEYSPNRYVSPFDRDIIRARDVPSHLTRPPHLPPTCPMMKLFNLRLTLLLAFCGVSVVSVLWFPAGSENVLALESDAEATPAVAAAAEEASLGIGSDAPKLDIEHWIQDGNGFFKPVTEFKPGQVYVVEFWATWCGPCVASMPHLAELQNRYRGQNVQIISVSDEPLETVTGFLERSTESPSGEPVTFAEVTAPYSPTTDPDRSTHAAYMEASQQQGIPTAFIVGKDSKIEWIGHPMEIDEPLDRVVKDSWPREEFAEMYIAKQSFGEVVQRLSGLANRGRFAEAIEVIDAELEKKLPAELQAQLIGFKNQIKLMGGMIDEDVTTFLRQRIAASQGDAIGIARVGWSLHQAAQQDPGATKQPALTALINESIEALDREVTTADEEMQPLLYDTLAHLRESIGDLDGAIKAQETAIERADSRTKERLSRFLDELKAAKQGESEQGEPKQE